MKKKPKVWAKKIRWNGIAVSKKRLETKDKLLFFLPLLFVLIILIICTIFLITRAFWWGVMIGLIIALMSFTFITIIKLHSYRPPKGYDYYVLYDSEDTLDHELGHIIGEHCDKLTNLPSLIDRLIYELSDDPWITKLLKRPRWKRRADRSQFEITYAD